ncbi:MAG: hypothetical protein BWK73_33630 [Thiothrix lacustris]|uniref:Uncharacterized protein n=1 Tax=Thiothrix lacustris TaxID=525917 RepID=A0A1Y1QH68_9GAMM|nr:MAG: hypothetical protein BWK73_33630 [Thiothrix lacustris]
MAYLNNQSLTIKLISGTSNVDVIANVDVSLSQLERFLVSGGLNLKMKCKLVGSDAGANGPDDDLYLFPAKTIIKDDVVTFSAIMSKSVLDEDSIGNDEVYANFCLISGDPIFPLSISVNSPEISGDF